MHWIPICHSIANISKGYVRVCIILREQAKSSFCYYWRMNWEVLVHCKAVWRSVGSIVRWGKRKGWLPFCQCYFLPASGEEDLYVWFFHPRTTFFRFFRSINILFMKCRNGRSRVTSILNLGRTFVIEMDVTVKYKAHIDYMHTYTCMYVVRENDFVKRVTNVTVTRRFFIWFSISKR